MHTELEQALAALNLHRGGEVFWLSTEIEASDEDLGIEDTDLTVEDIVKTERELVLA